MLAADTFAYAKCLAEFKLERNFPSSVLGPVDFRLFLRLAATNWGDAFFRTKPTNLLPSERPASQAPAAMAFAFPSFPYILTYSRGSLQELITLLGFAADAQGSPRQLERACPNSSFQNATAHVPACGNRRRA